MPDIGIVIGSKSDETYIKPAIEILDEFEIPFEYNIISAHRNPEKIRDYGRNAQKRGVKVLIAGAGFAAHLPGVLASWSSLPVIGIPFPSSELKAIDSLLSIVQMPGGIPVACVGIGSSGSKNAALLAAQILAISDEKTRQNLMNYRKKLAEH